MNTESAQNKLIIVSNRLPIVIQRSESGEYSIEAGGGGLVTALSPVLSNRGGTWIGWSGSSEAIANIHDLLDQAAKRGGYALKAVPLSEEEINQFYYGFSNEIIWPLFHDFQWLCNFQPSYWKSYCEINRRYADHVAEVAQDKDFIWIHDYHLMLLAKELRDAGSKAKLAFFLHIPFPSLDIYLTLPWREHIIEALMHYDLIGFQTARDKHNFLQCLRGLFPDVRIYGRGRVVTVKFAGREVRVGNFPISIDYNYFEKWAATHEVSAQSLELQNLLPDRQVILGIDRLDYTKGIPQRLEALRNALTRYPELHEKITLIQVVLPSREDIPQYHNLKLQIERLISEINGQFTKPGGWVPIHYVYRSLSRVDLLTYYRVAQIALITPLKDGMNLVAKEYCACSLEENCTLILSEFAGAAAQLANGALLVNPHDIESTADAIYQAFSMTMAERKRRMHQLRRTIQKQDIFWWVDLFLQAAFAKDLKQFPLLTQEMPESVLHHASHSLHV